MTRMLPAADCASRNRLASVVEWSMSLPSMPFESKKAVPASSKETPCLVLLLAAFLVSHSNTNYVYTKLELSASWPLREESVIGSVLSPSRRFLSEKQGRPSPRATKRGQSTLHHAAQSEKIPDPFLFPNECQFRVYAWASSITASRMKTPVRYTNDSTSFRVRSGFGCPSLPAWRILFP